MVTIGRMLQAHDQTAKAVAAGELPIDHAFTLGRALTAERAEVFEDYEAEFLAQARRLDHRQFHRLVATWAEVVDDLLGKSREGERYERRGFTVSELLDGLSAIEGTTDGEGAALFRKVFDVFDTADDPKMAGGARTPRQRRHDAVLAAFRLALVTAARFRAKATTAEPVDTMAVHTQTAIDVIVTYEVLLGLRPATLDNLACEIATSAPSPRRWCAAWWPIRPSGGSSPPPPGSPSTWASGSGSSPATSGGRSSSATAPVCGPPVTSPATGATPTTPSITPRRAAPRSPTAGSSAPATTT
jgi:Domain of unknown function (DUF222)